MFAVFWKTVPASACFVSSRFENDQPSSFLPGEKVNELIYNRHYRVNKWSNKGTNRIIMKQVPAVGKTDRHHHRLRSMGEIKKKRSVIKRKIAEPTELWGQHRKRKWIRTTITRSALPTLAHRRRPTLRTSKVNRYRRRRPAGGADRNKSYEHSGVPR